MFAGIFVWQSGEGSSMSRALETWAGKGFAALCTTFYTSAGTFPVIRCFYVFNPILMFGLVAAFVVRTKAEDHMLEEHFGEEWRVWAKNVPYRLIPCIY